MERPTFDVRRWRQLQNIDDETLKKFVGVAKKIHGIFKPFILGYSRLNRLCGGRLLQVLGVAAVALFVRSIARRFSGGEEAPDEAWTRSRRRQTVVAPQSRRRTSSRSRGSYSCFPPHLCVA